MCYALAILTRNHDGGTIPSGSNIGQWSKHRQKRKSTSPMQRNLADRSGRYYNNLHQKSPYHNVMAAAQD
jgi:hypothetical protein